VIKSFRDAETARVFDRRFSRRLPGDIQSVALRKLRMLNNAVDVGDLRRPPAMPTTSRSATTTEGEV
jgi:proteic killer suppression protein